MKATWPRTTAIGLGLCGLLLGSCDMLPSIFNEHEVLCRREARVIIHESELWAEYQREAEETYLARAKEFPDTGRVVVEYAPSFETKFGPDLNDRPNSVDGAVVRDDLYIVQNGKVVAQFVDFIARRDWAGSTIQTCLGSFPELYAVRKVGE